MPNGETVPSTIAPTPMDDFSPRLGLAYSPNWSKGFLGKLTGGPGKTSIRVGAGRFFTAIEGLTIAYPTGNPPYGLTYTSPEPPVMATPFVGALTGTQFPQQFPVQVPAYAYSPSNPDRMFLGLDTPQSAARSAISTRTRRLIRWRSTYRRTSNHREHCGKRQLCRFARAPSDDGPRSKSGKSGPLPQPQPATGCSSRAAQPADRSARIWSIRGRMALS